MIGNAKIHKDFRINREILMKNFKFRNIRMRLFNVTSPCLKLIYGTASKSHVHLFGKKKRLKSRVYGFGNISSDKNARNVKSVP